MSTSSEKRPSKRVRETRKRILQAAVQVFADQGYTGATTRGIAEAAGVSELTLFRHFGSKKNLFMAAIQRHSAIPGIEAALASQLSGDPRQDLTMIGTHFLSTLTERRQELLMTLYEAGRIPEVRQVSAQVPRQQREMLTSYMRRQIETGQLRDLDPSMMAQAFLGMLFAYAIYQALFDKTPPGEEMIRSCVDFFVEVFLQGVSKPGLS